MNEILNFITIFKRVDGVQQLFSSECNYWFATILFRRFIHIGAEIMYNRDLNQFATKINNKLFNISGEIQLNEKWVKWNEMVNSPESKSIKEELINL